MPRTSYPPVPRPAAQVRTTGVHAHGCPSCRRRIECTCTTPADDPICAPCRTGAAPSALLTEGRLPRACCRTYARPATAEERTRYRLVGRCHWLLCTRCYRTHPYPIKETV
jgi:hypothetical protein